MTNFTKPYGNNKQKTIHVNEISNKAVQERTKQKRPLSGKTKLMLEQKRNQKKVENRAKLIATMSPEDIRQQGLINSNLKSLEKLRIEIEKAGM